MTIVRSLSTCLIACFAFASANAQLAYVTFLHNSPDAVLKTIDLYVTQQGNTTKIEDIPFQQSKNLDGIFGDFAVNLKVAPGTSGGIGEAVSSYDFTPKSDSGYMAILNGVINTGSYVANPNSKPIGIEITSFYTVFEIADHSKTGFYIVHGATDLEAADVYIRGVATPLATNLAYGSRTLNPSPATRNEVTIDLTKVGDKTKVLASFSMDISSLASEVVVLVVSGFKTPADNNGSTDSLALLAVKEDGSVTRMPLIAGSQTARVQVVNNLPELQFINVDVWLGAESLPAAVKKIDNLGFRSATTFQEYPSGSRLIFGIAPSNSTLYRDTIFADTIDNLKPGLTYTLVLTGVKGASMKANPEGIDSIAHVEVLEAALEAPSQLGELAIRAGNFVTDANPLTITGQSQFIAGASYLESAPQYVPGEPRRDTIWVRDDSTGARIKGYVCIPCEQSRALLVLTSGFRDPAANNNGQAFKLIFVQTDGTVISNAPEVDTSAVSGVDDFTFEGATAVRAYPNPARGDVNVAWGGFANGAGATVKVFDATGNLLLTMPVQAGLQSTSFSTATLPTGMHFARVFSADGSAVGSTSFSVLK